MPNSKLRVYFMEGVEPRTPSLIKLTRQVKCLIKDEIYRRWKQPTPPFFRRLQGFAGVCVILSGVILAGPADLSPLLLIPAGHVFVTGGVIIAVCQLTTGTGRRKKTKSEVGVMQTATSPGGKHGLERDPIRGKEALKTIRDPKKKTHGNRSNK